MLLVVREEIYQIQTLRIEEKDDMRVKCDLCIKRDGDAIKIDNVYLVDTENGKRLVCTACKAKIMTDRRSSNGTMADVSSN